MSITAWVNGKTELKFVQITVTPPKLVVTPRYRSITAATQLTFTASVTPATVTNWNLAASWQWVPKPGTNGGFSPNLCGWQEKVCTRIFSNTGWLIATANIDGYALRDSARVYKVPCPTEDSLVDNEAMRDGLMDAIEGSNASASDELNRTERGGLLLKDRSTGEYSYVLWPQLGTNCEFPSSLPDNVDLSKFQIVASSHSHTYYVLEPTFNCKHLADGSVTPNVGLASPGASDLDDAWLKALNEWLQARNQPPVDEYIVAKDFVYRLDHNTVRSPSLTKWASCANFRL